MKSTTILLSFLIYFSAAFAYSSSGLNENALEEELDVKLLNDPYELHGQIKYDFRKSLDLDEEGCILHPEKRAGLKECGFNSTSKTILIIHGWTMSGIFESWMHKLVAAVQQREPEANVLVVDWLNFAHQLYPDAVNHTRRVGLSIADLLNWLQEEAYVPLERIHLIGYSLGAHIAGYAGTFVNGTLGRITGLDPAGPMFEGVESARRLSPDDADFVDVLHTYTREALGVSIGIKQAIGDIDIYPNGGDVQPGCSVGDVVAYAGGSFMDVLKCEHERAVHLFVDSLMSKEHTSFAYQCTDPSRFKKGICLSCRKGRCNQMGYNAKKMRKRRNSKLYLKTRADTPFGGFHYQMKMHVFDRKHSDDAEPIFKIKLLGAHNDSHNMDVEIPDKVGLNFTNTFLVFVEEDIGELLKIQLSWEGPADSFASMWKSIKTSFWAWNTQPAQHSLQVRRIRVKNGESQKKYTFCLQDPSDNEIAPGKHLTFTKCRDGWEVKPRKRFQV